MKVDPIRNTFIPGYGKNHGGRITRRHQLLWVFDLRKVQTITDEALEQGATLGKTAFSAAQRQAFESVIKGLAIDVDVALKFGFPDADKLKNSLIINFEAIIITL